MRIGDRDYRILICKNIFLGMMFRRFDSFDGMLFSRRAKEIWTPFCVPMKLLLIRSNLVVKVIDMKAWRNCHVQDIQHDSFIEIRPDADVKIGDSVTLS